MIDLHSHIIPNVDDGSKSMEQTIEMLKEAEKAGFTDIFATPHYIPNSIEQEESDVIAKVENLNKIAKDQNINIKIHKGEEVYLVNDIHELIIQNRLVSLSYSKNILIELPMHSPAMFLDDVIFKIFSLGYTPIIAHPERYDYVKNNIGYIKKLKENGVLFQANFGSFLGIYGRTAKKTLKKLLKSGLIDFMGSDCHRPNTVYAGMPEAIKALKKVIKEDGIQKICIDNPKKILG